MTNLNLTIQPPDKLSDLIELAISDACKLDHNAYMPNFNTWHLPGPNKEKCMVCLAGAVIAGTLGCSTETWITGIYIPSSNRADPESLTTTITGKALRADRTGDRREAARVIRSSNCSTRPSI